ncbi:GPP34 family phosphoprotein [Belliella marina]|uniref:GPP34 family phosphoprotein n=1 Tax=Belliella marina TaxID=1644146 RepID=A0ABW4VII1_9BACT
MELSLSEKLLLLAIHRENGKFITSDLHLNYSLAGAILLELSIKEHLKLVDGNVYLKDIEKIDSPLLLGVTNLIQESKKPRTLKYWTQTLGRKSGKFRWSALKGLESKRIVRNQEKAFLGIFPYKRSFILDKQLRNEIHDSLKQFIRNPDFQNTEQIALLGLIDASQMHKLLTSDSQNKKAIKKKIQEIVKENPIKDTVEIAIKEIQAAILTIIAISAATSASAR